MPHRSRRLWIPYQQANPNQKNSRWERTEVRPGFSYWLSLIYFIKLTRVSSNFKVQKPSKVAPYRRNRNPDAGLTLFTHFICRGLNHAILKMLFCGFGSLCHLNKTRQARETGPHSSKEEHSTAQETAASPSIRTQSGCTPNLIMASTHPTVHWEMLESPSSATPANQPAVPLGSGIYPIPPTPHTAYLLTLGTWFAKYTLKRRRFNTCSVFWVTCAISEEPASPNEVMDGVLTESSPFLTA